MKTRTLLLLCLFTRISLAQTGTWPVNAEYVYFGASELGQTNQVNYSLLQNKVNGVTFLNSPYNIHFRIGNSDHMLLSNSGNLGFGTTDPSVWFGGAKVFEMSAPRPVLKLTSTAAADLSTITFTNSSVNPTTHSGEFHVNYQYGQTDATKSKVTFFAYPGNDVLVMRADGYIGVGNPSPAVKLDILGAGAANTDLKVNGRIMTGDGTNAGGVWVSATLPMFMGQQSGTAMGLYNGGWRLIADNNGKVAIGTTDVPGDHKLYVNGSILTTEVNVKLKTAWPDYVFENNYELPSLADLEQYIRSNKHLPGVPSADEVKEDGLRVGEMNAVLLKKIEELTLHLIDQSKKIENLEAENQKLQRAVESVLPKNK